MKTTLYSYQRSFFSWLAQSTSLWCGAVLNYFIRTLITCAFFVCVVVFGEANVKSFLVKLRYKTLGCKYRLVMFLNKKKQKEIDIVPATWINYEEASDTLLCKFMPGPYDNEKIAVLRKMVMTCDEPLKEWPIDVRGKACKYTFY